MSKFRKGDRVILVNLQGPCGNLYEDHGSGSNVTGNVGVVLEVFEDYWINVLWDGIGVANTYRDYNLIHL